MASTASDLIKFEKMATGEKSGTWGTLANVAMSRLEEAMHDITNISLNSLSGGNYTLNDTQYTEHVDGSNTSESHCKIVKATGTLNSAEKIIVPLRNHLYLIWNATSGSYAVTVGGSSGGVIEVPQGYLMSVICDGTNVEAAGPAISVAGVHATVTASGDITSAGTVNVTGDTAAGDDAAIGYTSAEGLILTGQGSTNDVTIKNDADADVITIATGATNVDIVGDVTASTVNADGDTAASDNAAMGYTSAEGLILTGQGSTNDVTIKNDADADVITIATGATNVDIVGDVTASTVNADGDTAAADNAAMGYTSAEGLILTGQGSTNDVTIKNDADADVIEIPTGGTDVTMTGKLTLSKILLANTDTDTSNTGSVTLDFSANQNFVLTFTGDVTLANPSTEAVGQAGVIVCIQDGTGSRTLTLGTDYETAGGSGITLSTAANAVDVIPYFVKASASIQLGAVQKAFS